MWWLGSLPWAYCPTIPVISATFQAPPVSLDELNSSSSQSIIESSPPLTSIRPFTSCCTWKEYCQELASV